ncbi:flagellar hook-length control protein FliK [Achromobacter aloeverae]|uniref:Flagellar hook-length control protein FliK n=1 Tax=Achromobacter aloeverae TaxID=1750518 RepID=A0A4Q1HR44_9BURK|nr:flagellar hook-length control protein FliK [Achromobacter aloeverae]RXN92545.1 flagellar hook-length control protein FliK [Achromobacter aloeverae]
MTAAATTLLNIIAPSTPVPPTGSASRTTSGNNDARPAFSDVMSRQRGAARQDDGNAASGAPAANSGSGTAAQAGAKTPAASGDKPTKAAAGDADKDADTAADEAAAGADAAAPTLSQQALAMAALVAQITAPAPAPVPPQAAPAGDDAADALAATLAAAATPAATVTPAADDKTAAPAALPAVLTAAPATDDAAAETAPAIAAAASATPTAKGTAAAQPAQADRNAVPLATQDGAGSATPATAHVTRQAVRAASADADTSGQDSTSNLAKPALHGAAASDATATASNVPNALGAHEALANAVAASQAPVTVQAAPATTALHVGTPVGQPGWAADLGKQVVVLSNNAQQKTQTAELRLDPPDLGPLRITLTLNDGVAQASFVSSHAAVRQAVEAALPQLQQALSQAGISLGQTNVGDQGAQAGFAASDQGGRQGQSGGGEASAQAGGSANDTVVATVQTRRAANALVDTFA